MRQKGTTHAAKARALPLANRRRVRVVARIRVCGVMRRWRPEFSVTRTHAALCVRARNEQRRLMKGQRARRKACASVSECF